MSDKWNKIPVDVLSVGSGDLHSAPPAGGFLPEQTFEAGPGLNLLYPDLFGIPPTDGTLTAKFRVYLKNKLTGLWYSGGLITADTISDADGEAITLPCIDVGDADAAILLEAAETDARVQLAVRRGV